MSKNNQCVGVDHHETIVKVIMKISCKLPKKMTPEMLHEILDCQLTKKKLFFSFFCIMILLRTILQHYDPITYNFTTKQSYLHH